MTHQPPPPHVPSPSEGGIKVAQLRQVLALVQEIAGYRSGDAEAALDESARASSAYETAMPIVQRRFDALSAEAAAWAAAGVEALITAGPDTPRAAAARLAEELEAALARLMTVLRT